MEIAIHGDEVLARLPPPRWPEVPPHTPWPQIRDRWPLLRASCEAAASHVARAALGAGSIGSGDELVARIAKAFSEIYMVFGEGGRGSEVLSQRWTGLLALIAGAYGEWDLVAMMTGGALPAAASGNPTFRDNTILLARHLAVVARTRATRHADAAMAELRDQLAAALARGRAPDPDPDARFAIQLALIAAHLYFARAVHAPELAESVRTWLAGTPLVHEPAPLARAIAGGADVRATIFERYLPELSDQAALAAAEQLLHGDGRSAAIDAAAVYRFVAREPLPTGWTERADPLVAELLGGAVDPGRRADSVADLKLRARLFRAVSNIPLAVPANLAHALFARDDSAVLMITGRGTLAGFVPHQIFGDDFRQLGRYLLAARKAGAAAAAVQPAWLDFLARRSPRTSRLDLTWRDLALYQRVITHELAGAPLAAVGPALRAAITGL